ncbi:DUF1127 domain-containing protein [Psychromarinibacter sp. S121]|uniref:DUF1127 domain-containing protein n=1 Tax=Psychromarinibacter sp. S121 TaxID=3415127 RepID=UPI003C7B5A7A
MAQAHSNDALGYLSRRPLPPFSAAALRFVVMLVKWDERRRTRRSLGTLDPHLLDDIGVTRGEARTEAERPFWKD